MAVEEREESCHSACLTSASHVVRYSVEALFVRLFHFCCVCFWDEISKRRAINRKSIFGHFLSFEERFRIIFEQRSIDHSSVRFIRVDEECHECPTHDTDWEQSRHTLVKILGVYFERKYIRVKTMTSIIVQVHFISSKCFYRWGFYNFLTLNVPPNTL